MPKRWFAETSPNLSAILASVAAPWVWLYDAIQYVVRQTRIDTATDDWLDLIAYDYFGNSLQRNSAEPDAGYRARIRTALLREAATRSAIDTALAALIGQRPVIFEPARCMDTGAYGTLSGDAAGIAAGLAYGQAGGWGSLDLPLQFFVTASRPPTPVISMLAGYGTSNGGYGAGAISYADLSILPGYTTDASIQATLSSLLPVNAVAWLRII